MSIRLAPLNLQLRLGIRAGPIEKVTRFVVRGQHKSLASFSRCCKFVDAEYFSSSEVRAWIGAVNNKKGHEFDERVAEEFRKLHFKASASVQMTEFNVPPPMGDMGDIDVLAWSAATGLVYVTECKNLRFAMTVGEIVDQLNRFRGEANDELHKHMRRCEWLNQNLDRLAQVIGYDGSLKIAPLMVSNTIVPMQFAQNLPLSSENILPIGAILDRIPRT